MSLPSAGDHPIVSIVIPAHNAESTIELTLQSVQRLDYPDTEVIVVSDASTDGTGVIAERFGARVMYNAVQSGAAYARNVGCVGAKGEIFFFVDADVILQPDAVSKAVRELTTTDTEVVFGSYIAETRAPSFCSQFKNYQHHYTHQQGRDWQTSFWSGCGAIRRSLFEELTGFDVSVLACEDIEFGYAITRTGRKVRLLKDMCGEHLKRYTLSRLIRSDFIHRAIPWTRLIRSGRAEMGRLNTGSSGVQSTLLAGLSHLCLAAAFVWPAALGIFVVSLLAVAGLNRQFLGFLAQKRGLVFMLRSVPMLWLYFSICGWGYVLAHMMGKLPAARTPAPQYAWSETPSERAAQPELSH